MKKKHSTKHKSQQKKKKNTHPFCRKLVLIPLMSFSHFVVINEFCSAWVISQLLVLDLYLVSTAFLQLPICEPLLQLHSLLFVIARHRTCSFSLSLSLSLFPITTLFTLVLCAVFM
jgi:hypothetical protein